MDVIFEELQVVQNVGVVIFNGKNFIYQQKAAHNIHLHCLKGPQNVKDFYFYSSTSFSSGLRVKRVLP